MKKKFMLPCIAAIAIATFVGTKAFKSNASKENCLFLANVEALADDESTGVGACAGPSKYEEVNHTRKAQVEAFCISDSIDELWIFKWEICSAYGYGGNISGTNFEKFDGRTYSGLARCIHH